MSLIHAEVQHSSPAAFACASFFFSVHRIKPSTDKMLTKYTTTLKHSAVSLPYYIVEFAQHMTWILYCCNLSKLICSSRITTHFNSACDDILNALYYFIYTHRHTTCAIIVISYYIIILVFLRSCQIRILLFFCETDYTVTDSIMIIWKYVLGINIQNAFLVTVFTNVIN